MLFDADGYDFPKVVTKPNSLFNPNFSISHRPKWLLYHGISSEIPSPKRQKKTNSVPPQSWPSSQERTALQPEGIRLGYSAKMTQLNTPGILCILSSVGSSFFSLKGFIN